MKGLRGYAVAVLVVGGAILLALSLRMGLQPALPGQVSSPLLLVAVAITAWHGGNGPGFAGACLALLGLEYLFIPPTYALHFDWTDAPRFGAFLGAALTVSRLTAKRRQAECALRRTEAKLHAARVVQQQLLPSCAPAVPGVDIAGASFPANTVGGDYFDWMPLRGGALGIVVADVSGHGLGPALVMAETRAYLRALAFVHDDIGEILTRMNWLLADDTDEAFVTMFIASLDHRRGCFTYAGAGHEAYLLERSGEARRLRSTSLPLGVNKGLQVPCGPTIPLTAGQLLLLLTDGACETHSRDGTEFGLARTLEVVRANRAKSARAIIDSLHTELKRFAGGNPQEDDITMVVMKSQVAA